MKFTELSIPGVWRIDVERKSDLRGSFARTFCAEEFQARGLLATACQASVSSNLIAGTLRGMHYREITDNEAKLVRCAQGRVFDVALDLRPHSPTYRKWEGVELSADEGNAIYIPPGCAHGFISLCDNAELLYMMSAPFREGAERGARWDDPSFGIRWPIAPAVISERDRTFPDFITFDR